MSTRTSLKFLSQQHSESRLIDKSSMVGFAGVRVFVVEDEPLILLDLEDTLRDLGCEIAGSAGRLETALHHADILDFDVAVLDVNLGTDRVDSAASIIGERRIPIVYTTGYGDTALPRAAPGATITKPFDAAALSVALARALGRA